MASFQDPGTVSDEAAYAGDFVDYLNESCSPFHCVAEVKRRLLAAGFTQLDERKPWSGPAEVVRRGGRYFVTRNGSSLIAFAVGGAFDAATSGAIVIGGHTDSPCPKLKPVSTLEKDGHVMLGVVGYGGIWHSWFDRDLTVKPGGGPLTDGLHRASSACPRPLPHPHPRHPPQQRRRAQELLAQPAGASMYIHTLGLKAALSLSLPLLPDSCGIPAHFFLPFPPSSGRPTSLRYWRRRSRRRSGRRREARP